MYTVRDYENFSYWLKIAGETIRNPKLRPQDRLKFSVEVLSLLAAHNRMPEKQAEPSLQGQENSKALSDALAALNGLVAHPTQPSNVPKEKDNTFDQLAENAARRIMAEKQFNIAQEARSPEMGTGS